MKPIRVALAQINPTVGDIKRNAGQIIDYAARASGAGADIVAFPELALSGYPPEDLLLKPHFVLQCAAAVNEVAETVGDYFAIVGFPEAGAAGLLYNSAAVMRNGKITGVYRKALLPNYGVFDELRYFTPGNEFPVFDIRGVKTGLTICEDIWEKGGPASKEAAAGAKLIINLNASPYHIAKGRERSAMLRDRAAETGAFIAYVNMTGGQDELVFDGQSLIVAPSGRFLTYGKQFQEDMLIVDINIETGTGEALTDSAEPLSEAAEVYEALVSGIRDYARKNSFTGAVLGLSGGIDSALAAAIAADALGPENVKTVFMPTRFSSTESREDAEAVAAALRVELRLIDIEEIFQEYIRLLRPLFGNLPFGVAEENLQARVRGNILMALANKFGWLVLATGNKSEMAVGYSTLYGDMAGGFEVIKDVPKTLVYKLADYRNTLGTVIPQTVISKAPTAELRPDQKDSDSLPTYDILDPIINAYVENDASVDDIADMGFDRDVVEKVIGMIDGNEYKRRQAPPGIKITPKAFGRDRRLPITNKFRG
jgi:NAD+ synthase (glutamine-hydrolysing)